MRPLRLLSFVTIGVLLALFVTIPSPVSAVNPLIVGNSLIATALTNTQPVPGPGDPGAFGFVFGTLDSTAGQVCYSLFAFVRGAVAAHIHHAPVGVAGPVVVPLTPPVGGFSSGCATASPVLITAISQHPGQYYIDVHSTTFPGGAIRGQLG